MKSPTRFIFRTLPLFNLLAFAGCATIPVYEQGFVSRNGMTFSDDPVQNEQINLLSQIEPGSAISGGGQAAGCTACR